MATETFAAYLKRIIQTDMSHLDSATAEAAIAYVLGTSPKTVSLWLRGIGPRETDARLRQLYLESTGRALIRKIERELGRTR